MTTLQFIGIWMILAKFAVFKSVYDPCVPTGHNIIDGKRRLPHPNGNLRDFLCDSRMVPGWYRFLIDGAEAQIPTSCVTVNSCGTQAPIWLNLRNGKLPNVGQEGFYLGCIAWSFPGQNKTECCLFRNSIRVKNCGQFHVYFLQPTQGCHMAYCVEPKGADSSLAVETSLSITSVLPKLISLPRIQPVAIYEQVYLNCSFQLENTDSFGLRWLKLKGETTRRQHVSHSDVHLLSEVKLVTKMTHMYDLLAFEDNLQLDDEVICEVKAVGNDGLNSTANTFTWSSATFFAGLKIEPQELSIMENDAPHTIRVTSTIPVICPESLKEQQQCRMNLKLRTKTADGTIPTESIVVLSTCDLEMDARECGTNGSDCGFAEFQVTAVRDFIKRQSLTIRVIIDIEVDRFDGDLIWESYVPKPVNVTVLDIPSAVCRSFTDPHIITLDGTYFDFYKSGTFVFYKSLIRTFEVHNRIWFCGGTPKRVSCNCGFAAREDNQFVIVDMCNGNLLETLPELQVKILSSDDEVQVKVMESRQGKVISVLFPSGTYIRANVEKWGMSLTLRASSDDYNGTRGLCGTYDGNHTNDYHDNNGLAFADVQYTSSFVENWRLLSGNSFFDKDPMPVSVSRKKHFCKCSSSAAIVTKRGRERECSANAIIGSVPLMMSSVDITDVVLRNGGMRIRPSSESFAMRYNALKIISPNFELGRFNSLESRGIDEDAIDMHAIKLRKEKHKSRDSRLTNISENFISNVRNKREATETVRDAHRTESLSTSANLFPMFTTNTTRYFFPGDFLSSDYIGNGTRKWPTEERKLDEEFVTKLCTETLMTSNIFVLCAEYLGEQVADAVEICVTDVNLMDDPVWATYSLSLLESFCQESVINRRNLWSTDNEGHFIPPSRIVAALNCPNGCSDNGVCKEHGCECNIGYSSYDCSIPEVLTPRLSDMRGGGLCDVATMTCDTVDIIGEGFLNVEDLQCRFVPLKISNKHAMLPNMVTEVLSSEMHEVSCAAPITDLVLPLATWEVQVLGNSSDIASLPLYFTSYNSTCFICKSNTAIKKPVCVKKNSVCFIQGNCFVVNELNPLNSCEFCSPFDNTERWTTLAENATDLDVIDHPKLDAFDGEKFAYNFSIPNSVDYTSTMSLEKNFDDATLLPNGTFMWFAFSNTVDNPRGGTRIEKFTILVNNNCNITRRMNVEITVQRCSCQNGGVCIPDPLALPGSGRYHCSCPRFFTGVACELTANACESNPCYVGVQCFDDPTTERAFRCGRCPKRLQGDGIICQPLDIQECTLVENPCFLGVECHKIANEIVCGDCPNGYFGNGTSCKPICKWPCRRNEVCVQPNVCLCLPGYDGLRCHIAICKPFCQNGGVCVRPNVCRCPSGFTGKRCEKVSCSIICEHGGHCNGKDSCFCKPGFAGKRCEIVVCSKNCHNGGSCVAHLGCQCASGWSGPTCQVPLCEPVCRNGAFCTSSGNCLCPRGFFGFNCESGVCRPPCLNGGHCVRHNMCQCQKGWVGNHCHIPICEPCCQNDGKCWKPNKCDCSSGWRGSYCQKPICVDDCANDGLCIAPNVCACQSGYKGPLCTEAICLSKCRNGGTCISPEKCSCRPPFTGFDCGQINALQKHGETVHKIRHSRHRLRRIWT